MYKEEEEEEGGISFLRRKSFLKRRATRPWVPPILGRRRFSSLKGEEKERRGVNGYVPVGYWGNPFALKKRRC